MDQVTFMSNNNLHSSVFPLNACNVPELRVAAKNWSAKNEDIPAEDLQQIVTELIREPSSMKKCMGGILLSYMPKQREEIDPLVYEIWLEHVSGWGEIDAVCYGHFTSREILGNFSTWNQLIHKLARSENINKRRGAMVLLTKPVNQSPDKRLSSLAFSLIDMLKHEKQILTTKAISWLLRKLVTHHKDEVAQYIEANKQQLPKIAIRETLNKIRSGKKSGK
jgi:hypothetical protein